MSRALSTARVSNGHRLLPDAVVGQGKRKIVGLKMALLDVADPHLAADL